MVSSTGCVAVDSGSHEDGITHSHATSGTGIHVDSTHATSGTGIHIAHMPEIKANYRSTLVAMLTDKSLHAT